LEWGLIFFAVLGVRLSAPDARPLGVGHRAIAEAKAKIAKMLQKIHVIPKASPSGAVISVG